MDTTRSPLRSFTVTCVISAAKAPDSVAALARCTLVVAKWSCSARVKLYLAAQSSPKVPMLRPGFIGVFQAVEHHVVVRFCHGPCGNHLDP